MPRIYTVSADALTITAAGTDSDLIELTAADDKPIEVTGLGIYVTSEIQEAQEEWVRLKWIRGHTASGSTPEATPTPRPVNLNDAAAGFTCEMDNSATLASGGTAVDLKCFGFNVRAGYEIFYPERHGPATDQSVLLVLRMMSTLADDVSMSITAWVAEYP